MKIGNDSVSRYLEIMKKALSFSLWKEPGIPIATFNHKRNFLNKFLVIILCSVLRRINIEIVKTVAYDEQERDTGMIWPMQADTMIGLRRLDNIQFCVENVLKEDVQGDLIETGVWRGGACIFMRAILAAYQIKDRKVFVADSFEGLPKPDVKKYPQDKGDKHHSVDFLSVSEEKVKYNFKRYDLLDEQVVFLKGWFKNTLPNAPIEKLSVMRIDGDMYQSTIEALTCLYPKLSVGGYCIVDDYALEGCKQAVNDFLADNKISSPLYEIDWTGVYWKKVE